MTSLVDFVFDKVTEMCEIRCETLTKEKPETWLTTREVSDFCGLSIYQAHYSLTQLADKNKIIKFVSKSSRSLRWRSIVIFE